MRIHLNSIRSKIWFCVLIALAGYLLSTLTGFYANIKQYQHFTHLQEIHYPLSALGTQLRHSFQRQIKGYEDAFLTGEESLALEANSLQFEVEDGIDSIFKKLKGCPELLPMIGELQIIQEDYLQFASMAEKLYPQIAQGDLSLDNQKMIQELGQMQGGLLKDIKNLAEQLDQSLIDQIDTDKKKTLYAIFFLTILFLLVLAVVTFIVDHVSERLLVNPLASILKNIQRFDRDEDVVEPDVKELSGEIGQLAGAFWQMTENLKQTRVSKKYVDDIIRNMSGCLVVLNSDMTIQTINQQTEKVFGYKEEQLLGRDIELLFASKDTKFVPDNIKGLIGNGPVKDMEVMCRANDGHGFPAHFSGSSMYGGSGEMQRIICVFNDITQLKNAEQKLKNMAHYDALTGLANRNLFFHCLDRILVDAKRHNRIFALLYLDLDKFKPINDTFGHDVGDLVLKEVGRRLGEIIRSDDIVARMGGDEFVVILNGLKNEDDAEIVAEKIIKKITAPINTRNLFHTLGVSIGISVFPSNGTEMEVLIAKADSAMYQAKGMGGNSSCRSS